MTTLVDAIRQGRVDPPLAALLWVLAEAGLPIHVAGGPATRAELAGALRPLARDGDVVSDGDGGSLEDVVRQPVPLRPATGVVVVLGEDGRVTAAHLHRPPLRDAAGHVRPQGPAVLAVWEPRTGAWEHFAWGVMSELADGISRRAGDLENDVDERADLLADLAEGGNVAAQDLQRALAALRAPGRHDPSAGHGRVH